jgi:hypothetical protein
MDERKDKRPTPRLYHVKPGQVAHLSGYGAHLLVRVDRNFGYFKDGLIASLAHEVSRDKMVFGEGGWKCAT